MYENHMIRTRIKTLENHTFNAKLRYKIKQLSSKVFFNSAALKLRIPGLKADWIFTDNRLDYLC